MTTLAAPPLPTATLLTAEEFVARYADRHAELVQGIVKEYPVPFARHGKVCMTIGGLLWQFVEQGDLGHVMSNDTWIRTGSNPDTVRSGDICFFSYERLPRGPVPEGLLPVVPDLVVEVRSPTDRWIGIFTKVGEYLAVGVRAVVVIDPVSSSASVYRADELQQVYHLGEVLTLPDVLPGFGVPVERLFA